MERITVNTTTPYDVIIGKDILDEAVKAFENKGNKVVLLWDEAIPSNRIAAFGNALEALGRDVMAVSLEGGENAKTLESYEKITKILIDFNLSRSDVLVGIGGGTVTDLAGFIASTYKRGIDLVQVPTTLLAACDASVGGKNALNIGGTKNVIGTFYQPSLVLIETDFFNTLSDEIFSEGCAEVIKYAYLGDGELAQLLENKSLLENRNDEEFLTYILKRCVEIKAEVVASDERDNGARNILNFGHTLGHAIEAESGYNIHHGQAVAMGMVLITRIAERKGLTEAGTLGRMISVLTSHGLEWRCPYNINALIGYIVNDKKIRGDKITLIIPRKAGECYLEKIEVNKVREWMTEE